MLGSGERCIVIADQMVQGPQKPQTLIRTRFSFYYINLTVGYGFNAIRLINEQRTCHY